MDAPTTPCITRAPSSISKLTDNPHTQDARVKSNVAATNMRT